uniref:Uncharacterized protein n=1 Tax=Globodera rostochiensis TaxID=31243 RepID=A0A914HLV2_GLORO
MGMAGCWWEEQHIFIIICFYLKTSEGLKSDQSHVCAHYALGHSVSCDVDCKCDLMKLTKCPADIKRCFNLTCTLDADALSENGGRRFPNGSRSMMTLWTCLPPKDEGKCEIPNEYNGTDLRKQKKKYCRISCCSGNACNGTLGLRVFGTVAAMIAFAAAFFVRWN